MPKKQKEEIVLTKNGDKIPPFTLPIKEMLDISIVLYGPSKTGKTVMMTDYIRKFMPYIDEVFVVSPTEPSNKSFEGFIDPAFIHYKFAPLDKMGRTIPSSEYQGLDLNALWNRQEMKASIYIRANNIEILAELFNMLSSSQRHKAKEIINKIEKRRDIFAKKITKMYSDNKGELQKRIKSINKGSDDLIRDVYRDTILLHYKQLWGIRGLSEDHKFSLKYINFNPRLLLIFDDCAADLKKYMRLDIIGNLFYRNRHVFITGLYAFQDDTNLDNNLRKNAFISIFTGPRVCKIHFGRKDSGGYTKEEGKYVEDAVDEVFVGNRKLVYMREDSQHFYHHTAKTVTRARFGNKTMHKFCDKIQPHGATMDESNPYFDHFKV